MPKSDHDHVSTMATLAPVLSQNLHQVREGLRPFASPELRIFHRLSRGIHRP